MTVNSSNRVPKSLVTYYFNKFLDLMEEAYNKGKECELPDNFTKLEDKIIAEIKYNRKCKTL